MRPRARAAVVVGCLVVTLLGAWYAGSRFGPSPAAPVVGTVRLGPEAGEDVAAYLARLPATLPPDGVRASALVQFSAAETPAGTLEAVDGVNPATAVFRAPLPRVQTALRFEDLEPGVSASTALDNARVRAQRAAATDAARLTGRPGAVAAAEAAVLDRADCRCVVAVVVDGDPAGFRAVAARPAVRAVEAAPPGTAGRELALAPLLPEQTVRADPLPDDGPVGS